MRFRFIRKIFRRRRPPVCENVNRTAYGRNCLLLYITGPFRKRPDPSHQNREQVVELAKVIGRFGYDVDVIDFDNEAARLGKKYDLVVDLHPGANGCYRDFLDPGCRKVAYLTGSNPRVHNAAEMERLEGLRGRRNVGLEPRRQVRPFDKEVLESFDAVLFMGNAYNWKTYDEFDIRMVRFLRNQGYELPWAGDFTRKSPGDFLFLGGYGQVHKGLDLLLEVFPRNPGMTLHVCSGYEGEKDFCRAYERELFHTPNVRPVGFVDIRSERFRDVAGRCSYLVLPSCAEGCAGSVLTGMSAGLIPVVTRECGFDGDDAILLPGARVEDIENLLLGLAGKDRNWVEREGRRSMETVRRKFTKEAYAESVRRAFEDILGGEGLPPIPPVQPGVVDRAIPPLPPREGSPRSGRGPGIRCR